MLNIRFRLMQINVKNTLEKSKPEGVDVERYSVEAREKMRKISEAKFIRDALTKFGKTFDYSRVAYVKAKDPVEIVCPHHGVFTQTPDKHLQAIFGCPKCGVYARAKQRTDLGQQRFLKNFDDRFGKKLELLTPYISVKDQIKFRCKVHNEKFETTPDRLNLGMHGCPKCASASHGLNNRMTQVEFVQRVMDLFGDQFDLSRAIYSRIQDSVVVGCPIHGDFVTKPNNFLNSVYGCPKCGRIHTGYAADRIAKLEQGLIKPRPTTIALIKIEVFGISAFKLGITSRRLIDRYTLALREVIFETTLDELDALKLEQHLHGKYFRYRDVRIFLAGLRSGQRWGGDSEIYKEDCIPELLADLRSSVFALEANDRTYWDRFPTLVPPILKIRSVRKVPGIFNPPKPVIRLDTLEVFTSATAAAKAIDSQQSIVSAVCNGKAGRANGVCFAFLSDYKTGKTPTFDSRRVGSNHTRAQAVRCLDTGAVYPTLSAASKSTGTPSSKISLVCSGSRKSAGGLHWEYCVRG